MKLALLISVLGHALAMIVSWPAPKPYYHTVTNVSLKGDKISPYDRFDSWPQHGNIEDRRDEH